MSQKHVCIAVSGSNILCEGVNLNGTNSFARKMGYEYSVHAEAAAIECYIGKKAASKAHLKAFPSNTKVYILRFSSAGDLVCSAPCKNCARLLKKSGIQTCKIIHS